MKFIKEWGVVLLVALLLGIGPNVAVADRDGSLHIAFNAGRNFVWNALTGASNTAGQCNPNGMTEHVIVSFTNTGPNEISMWLQDSDLDTGPWANAIVNSMDVNPSNSPTLKHRGSFAVGPCFRLHSADTDIDATNTITPTLKTWR